MSMSMWLPVRLVRCLALAAALIAVAECAVADSTPGKQISGSSSQTSDSSHFDPGEVFINANGLYEKGDYEQAIALYQSLVEQGYSSGVMYYNLGNAYLRNGELGRAIAAYRRSQARQPRNEDLAANLAFARKTAKDALSPPQPSVVSATLFFWHYDLSVAELAAVVLSVNLLFWATMALSLLGRGSETLRWIRAVLLILLLATATSLAVHHLWPQRLAVIVPQEVDVRTGPSDEAVVHFKLHAGSEVSVEDQREGWFRIVLPDGQQGWVDASHVAIAEL